MVKAQLAFDRRDKNQRMCAKDIGAPASSYRIDRLISGTIKVILFKFIIGQGRLKLEHWKTQICHLLILEQNSGIKWE
jgi:hypothetical protein